MAALRKRTGSQVSDSFDAQCLRRFHAQMIERLQFDPLDRVWHYNDVTGRARPVVKYFQFNAALGLGSPNWGGPDTGDYNCTIYARAALVRRSVFASCEPKWLVERVRNFELDVDEFHGNVSAFNDMTCHTYDFSNDVFNEAFCLDDFFGLIRTGHLPGGFVYNGARAAVPLDPFHWIRNMVPWNVSSRFVLTIAYDRPRDGDPHRHSVALLKFRSVRWLLDSMYGAAVCVDVDHELRAYIDSYVGNRFARADKFHGTSVFDIYSLISYSIGNPEYTERIDYHPKSGVRVPRVIDVDSDVAIVNPPVMSSAVVSLPVLRPSFSFIDLTNE